MADDAASPREPFVPVPSGWAYRVDSLAESALATARLALELQHALERFAREAGFTRRHPVGVVFKPGVVGHHRVGRAVDLYAVAGVGLDQWKAWWDTALARAGQAPHSRVRDAIARQARRTNLGWRLYKALQIHGRWAQPPGYPIQLFGPWTRSEGPWRSISDRLLHAHRDHIHIAR
jgi:hypothetical protein